ncbi:trehalase family glycosidase [Bacteroides sp.]|uniref:MGH1-like glycoside hydrolase domain-containing protein n=1 Tax=Bacteroides sp. TaxID=29523 RepID=UPI0026177B51|nr:trehalase family glycosidase [Bacteroides sp.]
MRRFFSMALILLGLSVPIVKAFAEGTPEQQYEKLQKHLAKGWNTWDTRSVLTHVYLPYGLAVDLNLISVEGNRVNKFRIGDRGKGAPLLQPGPHSYDGTYTKMTVNWQGHKIQVESAARGSKNIILIKPLSSSKKGSRLAIVPKSLWKRGNTLLLDSLHFTLASRDKAVEIKSYIKGGSLEKSGREYLLSLDRTAAICCGEDMELDAAVAFVDSCGNAFVNSNRKKYGAHYDCFNAMQSVLGWDNIYDPGIRKVITPVSRIWSSEWFASEDFGGFTLFCWDTYFASMMLAVGNKELAYANAVEITKAITESGFVPNCYYSNGFKSRDRSQPPVGALAVWTIYRQYKEKWLLELVYKELLAWNRWWEQNREDKGLLCLGSNPYEKVTYFRSEFDTDCHYGAVLESGLDNSPMYDGVPFNKQKHLLEQNDVGMSSLYVMDCDYLERIARELGYKQDADELQNRAERYRKNLTQLWDDETGFYYNRSTRDMKYNYRTSPTCFYPLLAKVPTQLQAERMVNEHLLNPDEFWGEYVIPSVPRNDPAFRDNEYWRGRIWAPLNYLVYLGLKNYNFPEVRQSFAEKSKNLLLKSWLSHGYVFENYNAISGEGDDVVRSDKFYHWGALLGYISLLESGVCH